MNPKIRALANLMRTKREQGRKFALMLGAGASFDSGVPKTTTIMEELLQQYGPDINEGSLRNRFDKLWSRSGDNDRDVFLSKYLDLRPSHGYIQLAELIRDGYFDLIITFNFDQLLERALREAGANDISVIVRGEYRNNSGMKQALEQIRPRVKVLKMHGGLKGGDNFLFSRAEMHAYPRDVEDLFMQLTASDIIVCGYSFGDQCVLRAFADKGGALYYVNPGGAPENLQGLLINRNSLEFVIDREAGQFDKFFTELHREIGSSGAVGSVPKANPFKFLLSYEVRDKAIYCGRKALTQQLLARFENDPPKLLHLLGPAKAGKTSLARAGFIANLDESRFKPVYVRSLGNLDSVLRFAAIKLMPGLDPPTDPIAALKLVAANCDKHIVIVLDQFERIVDGFPETENGRRQLAACLAALADCAGSNMSFVCVGVETVMYFKALTKTPYGYIEIPRLSHRLVGPIISRLARHAGIEFQPDVIRKIVSLYKETTFTLAHVQAVCNFLASSAHVDMASFDNVLQNERDALDVALNVHEIVSRVEDIPDDAGGRNLFRKVMKIIPHESKKFLARHLHENFADLLEPPETPAGRAV